MSSCVFSRSLFKSSPFIQVIKTQAPQNLGLGLRWAKQRPVGGGASSEGGWGRAVWKKLFGKYLLTTNIVSSGILMMAGDMMSQEIEHRRGLSENRMDGLRIGQMFAVGCLQGPLHHYFYKWLDDIMPVVTMKTTAYKILSDQFLISPICILLFFYPACLLENKTMQEATTEIKSKFLTVYMADWCIWPIAQFVNFYYLPTKYRVIYINVVTMLYNIFLSYVKHHDIDLKVLMGY